MVRRGLVTRLSQAFRRGARMDNFDRTTIVTMRSVLQEAAQELGANMATQAKMAETLTRTARDPNVSREQLKAAALESGREPAP